MRISVKPNKAQILIYIAVFIVLLIMGFYGISLADNKLEKGLFCCVF